MKPKISLDSLIVLDAIARRASFAAAAEELHRVPSAITYAIRKLEQSLAVKLFDRRGHRAELTEAGQLLLKEGRSLLSIADNIERDVQRVATGWEAELRISVDDWVPYDTLLDICQQFYQFSPNTQLRLSTEILGGTWDALLSGRADLVIGVLGETPLAGAYSCHPMAEVEFIFVVAANHPLATMKEPLASSLIKQYRAIAAADTSRQLAPKTVGLLAGQAVMTVADLHQKRLAQIRGLGVGHLPYHMIKKDIADGTLIVKETEAGGRSLNTFNYAWNTSNKGKALAWFKQRLCDDDNKVDWFKQ